MVTCGTVTVGGDFDPGQVNIESCAVTDGDVAPGGIATATVTVRNDNDQAALFDIRAVLGSEVTVEEAFHVPANDSATYTVRPTAPSDAGEYDLDATLQNKRAFEGD